MEIALILAIAVIIAAGVVIVRQQTEMGALRADKARLEERVSMLGAENDARARAREERMARLAEEAMQESQRRLRVENEAAMGRVLTPLREDIERFRKSVGEAYSAEARERFSLSERVRELVEANRSIGREARELADALRGNSKVQGDWGEMILQTILEKSGLQEGIHFVTQQTTDETGRTLRDERGNMLRPDVVVYYPGDRCIVVDSKVSLTAFVNMTTADDEATAAAARNAHVASVRSHIAELATKNYQDYVGNRKTDFVMMFIPNEAAYIEAMKAERNLWQEAYDKRVLIVSPTHLIAALRLVAQLWRHDAQARNAIEIATSAGRMYDKFVAFTDDMDRIDKAIRNTAAAHSDAMKKLRDGTGNLISRAEKLRELGAKATKQLKTPTETQP